jgi:hypothetical protein
MFFLIFSKRKLLIIKILKNISTTFNLHFHFILYFRKKILINKKWNLKYNR